MVSYLPSKQVVRVRFPICALIILIIKMLFYNFNNIDNMNTLKNVMSKVQSIDTAKLQQQAKQLASQVQAIDTAKLQQQASQAAALASNIKQQATQVVAKVGPTHPHQWVSAGSDQHKCNKCGCICYTYGDRKCPLHGSILDKQGEECINTQKQTGGKKKKSKKVSKKISKKQGKKKSKIQSKKGGTKKGGTKKGGKKTKKSKKSKKSRK
jgi:hypothetical protein